MIGKSQRKRRFPLTRRNGFSELAMRFVVRRFVVRMEWTPRLRPVWLSDGTELFENSFESTSPV